MASCSHFNEFDKAVESWTHYIERLKQFFVANGITSADRKRAIFLTVVGPSTYGLLRDLLSPQTPTSKTLEQLIKILNQHFEPVPSEIMERYKFNNRIQQTGESVTNYIAELRRMAKFCNYGASLDKMLRDRLVCGMQDEIIRSRLLSEAQLTLARATEIAVSMEASARNAVDLRNSAMADVHIPAQNKYRRKKPPAISRPPSSGKKCYRCGDQNHQSHTCTFRNATCHSCYKVGHLAKVCQSKGKSTSQVNIVQEIQTTNVMLSNQYVYNNGGVGEALNPAEIVVALYSFNAEDDEDLSFQKGDRLAVIDDSGDGWLFAYHLTQMTEGYIPGNYVAYENYT